MKKISYTIIGLITATSFLLSGRIMAAVSYDANVPQLAFAAQELKDALTESGKGDLQVSLKIKRDEATPEAFEIRVGGTDRIEVIGSDANGAMYGGFEVAERIRMGLPIEDMNRSRLSRSAESK